MKSSIKFVFILLIASSCTIQAKDYLENPKESFDYDLLGMHPDKPTSFKDAIQKHALWQTKQEVIYDGSYVRLDYPGGDVSTDRGVCTDVVVRALRSVGIDLQKEIHEDMKKALSQYNKRYKTKHMDPSIDHRRTQNIETYLERKGCTINPSKSSSELGYQKGDIVFFDFAYGHVGIVTDILSEDNKNTPLLVHNIGSGPVLDNFLSDMKVSGHYRLSEEVFKGLMAK